MNLRVGDGVQQLPLFFIGEDEFAELLSVNLPVLEQDLRAKVEDDARIRRSVLLHNWFKGKAL